MAYSLSRVVRHSFGPHASTTLGSVEYDFRPRRIILLRHGQSLGNVDASSYVKTADWRIPLTELGMQQACEAGKQIRDQVGVDDGQQFLFYYSPYLRTQATLREIQRFIPNEQIISEREDPRISEQQLGNFQNVEEVLEAKNERQKFGRFYYRYPSGEAGLDVYSRVSSFINTLVRDCYQYNHAGYDLNNMNVVIVTHGLALRLFLMRWFQFSVEEFEMTTNPNNAQIITMQKKFGKRNHRWLELDEADRLILSLPECCGTPRNVLIHELRGVNG
eukprot:scaffold364113_cov55-Attheya_sp.AAC.2